MLADDITSKTALRLLFQLVQWQLRKAEKYKEARAARCFALPSCLIRAVQT